MKQIVYFLVLLLLLSCNDTRLSPETNYSPILMLRDDMNALVKPIEAQPIKKTGKLYLFGNYIFLNELYEGIRIINNSNPRAPVREGFIRIPANVDIAVKNNILYADNGTDLLTFDVSNVQQIKFLKRVVDIFPEIPPPNALEVPLLFRKEKRPENTVIIAWRKLN